MKNIKDLLFSICLSCLCISLVLCQSSNSPNSSENLDPAPVPSTTNSDSEDLATSSPDECQTGSSDCEACMNIGVKCLWCATAEQKCMDYPYGQVIPRSSVCPLKDARWGTCSINYEALLISVGIIGGILFLLLSACCCYCCCLRECLNKRRAKKNRKEDHKEELERDTRRIKHDERRAERKSRMDEIRQKYGLMKDDNPYEKFGDAEA